MRIVRAGVGMKKNAIVLVVFVLLGLMSLVMWSVHSQLPREQKIVNFFKTLQAGSNPDYAVVKTGASGVERTIVVFAFADNGSVCKDIADYFNRTPSGALAGTYQCEALN